MASSYMYGGAVVARSVNREITEKLKIASCAVESKKQSFLSCKFLDLASSSCFRTMSTEREFLALVEGHIALRIVFYDPLWQAKN